MINLPLPFLDSIPAASIEFRVGTSNSHRQDRTVHGLRQNPTSSEKQRGMQHLPSTAYSVYNKATCTVQPNQVATQL